MSRTSRPRDQVTTGPAGSSLATKLLKAVVSPVIFVIAIELGTRMLGLSSGFFLMPSQRNCIQRSTLLSLEFRPNCQGTLERTEYRTNSLGLRGGEVRQDGTRRILCIGDSCTWGWRVKEDETYPAVLQQLLDARVGPGRFEVINAGVPGYTSYQGLVYLRERGLALQPSIVIIGYGFNDTFPSGDIEEHLAQLQWLMPAVRLDDFLLNQSTLYRWLRWRRSKTAPKSLPVRVPPEKYERNMAEMIGLARNDGAKIMLLSFWNPFGKWVRYRQAMQRLTDELHVPTIVYRGPKLDIVHPTAAGYRQLAEEVFDRLQVEGYLE